MLALRSSPPWSPRAPSPGDYALPTARGARLAPPEHPETRRRAAQPGLDRCHRMEGRGAPLTTWLKLTAKSKMRLDGDALVLIINDDAKPIEEAH